MKYIKTFEKLSIVKFSNLDKLVDKVKNKFGDKLEKEFSKYLEPATIIMLNKEVKAFLLTPDFGTTFNIDFTNMPYKTVANVCVIFKENNKWKRSAYVKLEKKDVNYINNEYINYISDFVINYVNDLKTKYERRKDRIFKKTLTKYNL